MPSEHSHVMGGSTAEQRANCPASYQLELQMPEKPTSEFAERGSMLHAAMELIITADPAHMGDAEVLFDQLEGQDLGFEGHEITRELINEKLRPAVEAWFEVFEKYKLDDWFVEQRVNLEAVIDGAFGTADIIAIDQKNRLHILDWKFGDGVPVPVEGNYGAGFYAAAALYDPDMELQAMTADVKQVVLHIVQPRSNYPNEKPLQSWETTVDWVEDFIDLAVDATNLARSDNPPAKTGKWCRWCAAKPICPEYKRLASEALETKPEVMDAIQLAAALRKAEQLKPWIDSVFELTQQEMERGVQVPGYKLVQKQARRIWTDPVLVEKALRKGRIKVADIFKKTLISPAQAEKLDKKLYTDTLSDLVESKSSGLTIVPDTDKRPAVSSGVNLLASKLENTEKRTLNTKQ